MASPFVYEAPVRRADLIDREDEAALLLDRLLDSRNSRLEAPRRYGKTSLLLKVLDDCGDAGVVPVYVNFLGVLTTADIADRIERAYREQLDSPLRRWFTGLARTLRPTLKAGGPLPVGAELTLSPADGGLLDRLSVPRRLLEKHGKRCAIVFDEFQDVLRAGEQVDAVIRSELERQGDAAAYVFSGSHPGMMRELFGDRRRAFFAQAGLVELGPLDEGDLAEHVGARFAAQRRDAGEALDALLDLCGGHPQRAMLLAHHLFERTPPAGTADSDTWSAALLDAVREVDGEIHAAWRSLTATQQRLVSTIADGTVGLASREALARYGLAKSGAHRQALERLEGDGHLVRSTATASGWQIVDPLFALWLRSGRAWPIGS
jgi:uncharacterized protein